MPRPLIGITLDYADKPNQYMLPCDYATSVERAGGLPVALPYRMDLSLIPELLDRLDGILFSGGEDLDPLLFGEQRHPNAEAIDPQRQQFELALLAAVEQKKMPTLGVCLGSQLMNVHRGGSLIQFLPHYSRENPIEHRKVGETDRRLHPVLIEPDTVLARAIGKQEILANTRHKQAINRVGRGLRVTARAPDGVIEAIEDPSFPLFLAVQWHPENLSDKPEHLAPFKLLVEAASQRV